jgi:hypothetical protein
MLRNVDEAALRDRVTAICRALPEVSVDERHRPVDWEEVTELLRDSYRLQAPKRLIRLLDDG